MANYNDLKTAIDAVIKTNGRQEISGAALNTQLKNMITELGAGYQYMGVATPATNPSTPDYNVFYLASEAGTYTNFGGIVVNEGEVCALVWNGAWTKQVTGAATAEQVNQLGQKGEKYFNATGSGISGDTTLIRTWIKRGDKFFVSMISSEISGIYRVYVRYSGQSSSTALQYKSINTDNEFIAQDDIDYVGFSLSASDYSGTGSFVYRVNYNKTEQRLANLESESNELAEDISNLHEDVNSLNDEIGISYKNTFTASSSEHPSTADAISVSFNKGDTIIVLAEKGTGETTDADPVFWFRSGSTNIQSAEVSWGIEKSVVLNDDVDNIGLYIYPVTTYGTFSISAKKQVTNTINGRITNIENVVSKNPLNYPYTYFGKRLDIARDLFNQSIFKTLSPSRNNQSMVIYGDYLVMFMHDYNTSDQAEEGKMTANVYSISSGALLSSLNCPYGALASPHCNSATLGNIKKSADSILPVIYVSQWNGEKACLVYDIQENNGVYTIDLVQTITISGIDVEICGRGGLDWCFDKLHNRLYSLSYYTESDAYAPGNKTMIMAFNAPSFENNVVTLTESDILLHYELPFIKYRQDLCYNNGNIIVSNGMTSYPEQTKITSISVNSQTIETEIPIGMAADQEPEGLDVYNGNLIMTRGNGALYQISIF